VEQVLERAFQKVGDKFVGSRGQECEQRGDYAICTAQWWPFKWILEPVMDEEIGSYSVHAIFCFGHEDDDPRCRE